MITIKNKMFVAIATDTALLSGKQGGEPCLVVPGVNGGSVMFVKAGVPVEDMTVHNADDLFAVHLNLIVSGIGVRVFSNPSVSGLKTYKFDQNFTFYCDARVYTES